MLLKANLSLSRVGLILILGAIGTPLVMAAPSFSQTTPTLSPEQTAALKEAEQLNQQLIKLYKQGNYREAIPIAQRALAIRETALGADHPDVAQSLNNLAGLYQAQGNYPAAEPLYKRALVIREKALGADHPDVATSLNNLALLYQAQGNYLDAEPLYKRALAIDEKSLEADHPLISISLNNLAGLYYSQGKYTTAEPLYKRALVIREKALGAVHPDVATSLNNLATLYCTQGNYLAAEPLYKRALAIDEKALGANHPDVAIDLDNLAELYRTQGNYLAAEPLYKRSLAIREKALGVDHPAAARSLNNLGLLYYSQGNYLAAEPLYKRSLAIDEKALGANHPDVANSLNNLASLYQAQGNYPAAEPLYKRSVAIRRKALGADHPDVAQSLNNLASLYRAQGNYPAAEPLYKRALAIHEKALGANHPDVASSLNNLASLYQAQGNYPAAEPLYKRSLAIYEKALGADHPNFASGLNNLGLLYYLQGNYPAAESLYKRSLAIREKALGVDHPDVASSLHNLAGLYDSQGNYSAAEPLYKLSLAIYEKALGVDHPDIANSFNGLTVLYHAQGNIAQAITSRQKGLEVEEHNLKLNLASGSETQKQAYMQTVLAQTGYTVSLHVQAAPTNPAAIRLAFTAILQRKGRLLDVLSTNLQTLRQRLTPDIQPQFDQWLALKSQLANFALKNTPIDKYRPLQQQAEELESTLNRRSTELQAITETVTLEAVQKQIPSDSVLIEFFRYSPFDPKAARKNSWGKPRYVAYILHSQGEPKWVDLGEADALEKSIQTFRQAIGRNPNNPDRDSDPQLTIAQVKQTARELDQKLMQPIRPLLGNAKQLLISPDSQLNLIPFAALVDEQNRFLLETYDITYLSSGRDLLHLKRTGITLQQPVLFSDPDYGKPSDKLIASIGRNPCETKIASRDSDPSVALASKIFCSLPNVAAETSAIQTLLPQAQLLSQAQATKTAAKKLRSPSILHFATHGFFLADPPNANPDAPIRQNPLSLSALVLANFNQRQACGDDPNCNGLLTAQDVTTIDLRGTKLVFLSACETGLGKVTSGEGVYGLRRAFTLAGVESQVMSLWSVDDKTTRELVESYYKNLKASQGRSQSLKTIQLDLLKKYQYPYYWAAFIPSGNWTAIPEVFNP
ncbi:tetratricopeptide repeat protein [Tumidithrix elongata RA019]|uniref:Tetratricopeptide repeat protein n=1 Tax=Tumidithrix elongata BACA0141 TaxID=2716417 RepID=A0AAW9Q949_9CYAN|nr:tetratricopeptide repeat protein [Tumidithrix elongata RA019]